MHNSKKDNSKVIADIPFNATQFIAAWRETDRLASETMKDDPDGDEECGGCPVCYVVAGLSAGEDKSAVMDAHTKLASVSLSVKSALILGQDFDDVIRKLAMYCLSVGARAAKARCEERELARIAGLGGDECR